jgi:hypothetical protein
MGRDLAEETRQDNQLATMALKTSFLQFVGCAQCGERGVVMHKCSVCQCIAYCGKKYTPELPFLVFCTLT